MGYTHSVEMLLGNRTHFCNKMKHAYTCEQPFDYCPSCGFRLNPQEKEVSKPSNRTVSEK